MDFDDYQNKALESIAITEKSIAALAHRSLGLTGEAGIVANQIKKAIRDNDGNLDAQGIKELKQRLGDVLYYISALSEYFGMPLSEVAEHNLEISAEFKKTRNL